jgi:predicted MFS family arabinose efflux permease
VSAPDIAPPVAARSPASRARLHPAWIVAAITFVTILGAGAFRSVPGVLMDPLHKEFGWSHATIGAAMSINLTLFGLMSPFAAALMDRFGIRPVVCSALVLVSAGSGLTVLMTQSWQLLLFWGVFVGVGTGSMSMAFVATVSTRWFVQRRGLVTGVLTAANATGQLIFLPLVATVTKHHGWRTAALIVAVVSLTVVPLVFFFLRNHPHDMGLRAYGATDEDPGPPPTARVGGSAAAAVNALFAAAHTRIFWLLAGSFAICGASTNGLIGTHFIPAAQDHGMPATTAASLLALVGVFDIAGTIASGWLTDRYDPRLLLVVYYLGRGLSLMALPSLLSPNTTPSTWVFILFYGLDWVATVPPTVALCRRHFGATAPVVFGWVFAAHQLGAAVAASGAGMIRDRNGNYDLAFYCAAALCAIAVGLSAAVGGHRAVTTEPESSAQIGAAGGEEAAAGKDRVSQHD